mmetsp:Transcript_10733/g.19436  ORF Transcript_10733/g.19436 Transcript_10733/m.19436 type:complete len:453 (+) Transcript_10733:45-1403(+)
MKLLSSALMLSTALAVPSQVHLSLGGAVDSSGVSTGMYVMWKTDGQPSSTVRYGTSEDDLSEQAQGSSKSYLDGHGFHHTALMENLSCDLEKIFYQVGDEADGWSEVFSFKRAPCASSGTAFSISVFGDMGYLDSDLRPPKIPHGDDPYHGLNKVWSATYSRNMLESLKNSGDIDWVFHVGDIGYVDDSFASAPLKFTYEEVYDGYMDWLQNLTSTMPYMVAPGNHESECHSPACIAQELKYGRHLRNFTAFNERWTMPSEESGGSRDTNMWYSFNYGSVHFVSINTETDWDGAEEQGTGDSHIPWLKAGGFGEDGEFLTWLEADLKAAYEEKKAGGRKWIIAAGHRPYNTIQEMKIEEMFIKYEVDVYFAGHSHSYSRTTSSDKPVYIVAGGAGCDEMGPSKESLLLGPLGQDSIESDKYSTGVLDVSDEKLSWRLIDSIDGSIIDSVDIL